MKRIGWRISGWWGRLIIVPAVAAVVGWAAPTAFGKDTILWTDPLNSPGIIGFGNLDGTSSPPGTLNTGSVTLSGPWGIAPDPAAGKLYWSDEGDGKIFQSNLDGSGAAPLPVTPADVDEPIGMSVDHAAGKIYWANVGNNTIAEANLDGSGAQLIPVGSATVNDPLGLAVDPAAGRIYWSSNGSSTISFAKLDGSGGRDLTITGAAPNEPAGLVIDRANGKLYWGNFAGSGTTLESANLDGSDAQPLPTPGIDQNGAWPGAINPTTGKIYWSNLNDAEINVGNIDGTGGQNLYMVPGTAPSFAAVVATPKGIAVPRITGGPQAPTTLGCTLGGWAGDIVASFLYQAPQNFAFSWFKNGVPIAGAAGATLNVTAGGSYTCRVTAQNFAGASSQASAPFSVASPPPPPPPPTASATGSASGASATLTITCHGVSGQACAGPISLTVHEKKTGSKVVGVTARKHKHKKHEAKPVVVQVGVGAGSYSAAAGRSTNVRIALNAAGVKLLGQFSPLQATVTFGGTPASQIGLTFSLPQIRIGVSKMLWAAPPASEGPPFFTRAFKLVLTPLPVGAQVKIGCHGGGCPFAKHITKAKKKSLDVTALFGAHRELRPGAKVTFAISAADHIGELLTYTLNGHPGPKPAIQCLPPGSAKAVKC